MIDSDSKSRVICSPCVPKGMPEAHTHTHRHTFTPLSRKRVSLHVVHTHITSESVEPNGGWGQSFALLKIHASTQDFALGRWP